MDIVSHALVGDLIQVSAGMESPSDKIIIISFAILPDIPVIFLYSLLGHQKGRPYWIPYQSDWEGVRDTHPHWAMIWEIPHSMFFFLFIMIPVVYFLQLPKISLIAYLSHIFIDLLTHKGEWAVKPFYPFPLKFQGFTDAWAWPFRYMGISWVTLIAITFILKIYF